MYQWARQLILVSQPGSVKCTDGANVHTVHMALFRVIELHAVEICSLNKETTPTGEPARRCKRHNQALSEMDIWRIKNRRDRWI